MRYMIFSDLHDVEPALPAIWAIAEEWGAQRIVYLGDVGRKERLFTQLRERGAICLFGNWEVSGLSALSPMLAQWVGEWPAFISEGNALFCHATPDMPAEASTTAAAARLVANGMTWRALFPRLHRDEKARWQAYAALEAAGLQLAFYGHTHIQEGWSWHIEDSKHVWRHTKGPAEIRIEQGEPDLRPRYLIGVGSAGMPDDGPQGAYALYDSEAGIVSLRRL